MSLLTCCPACTTYYRVVPDQLRISDGWVKCGQCGDIFDASQNLIEMAESAVTQPKPPEDSVNSDAALLQTRQVTEAPSELDLDVDVPADVVNVSHATSELPFREAGALGSPEAPSSEHAIQSPHFEPSMQGLLQKVSVDDDVFQDPETSAPAKPSSSLLSAGAQEGLNDVADLPSLTTQDVSEASPATFLAAHRDKSTRFQKTAQVLLWGSGFLLALTLFGQGVYQNRDLLAAKLPEFKPVLSRLCEVLGCSIRPYRQIESLVIDSANFEMLSDGMYQFGFVLKNTSDMTLALPSVELTLTDAQDRPLLRRAFNPAELSAAALEIEAKTEWTSNVGLQLKLEPNQARVLGYRLVAFYP